MQSFTLGPLAFSVASALLVAAVFIAFFIGNRVARPLGTNAEPALWAVLFVAVSSARLAFLIVYWRSYADAPWTVLDLRDGGFNVAVGIAGGTLMALVLGVRRRPLRKPLAVALLSGAAVWAGATALVGQLGKSARLPDVALSDLDGNAVRLSGFSGKPVVVNLWATWCPPCRREMPVLRDAQRANPDVVFVFANQGEYAETVKRYLQSEGLVLDHVLLDPRGVLAAQVGSVGLPTTLFYDAAGKQVNVRVGAVSAATLAKLLEPARGARD